MTAGAKRRGTAQAADGSLFIGTTKRSNNGAVDVTPALLKSNVSNSNIGEFMLR